MPIVTLSLVLAFEKAPNALLEFLKALDEWLENLSKDSCLRDYKIIIEGMNPVIVDWAEVPADG